MFKLQAPTKGIYNSIKGLFQSKIICDVRIPTSDWSIYFGKYQNQKWGGWDSESCWCLSAVNCLEDQMEWLWKNNEFTEEAKGFFIREGFIDEDGDFSISERFYEILSGVHDEGNSQMAAWDLTIKYGILPRAKLTYSVEKANSFPNKEAFNADYFDTKQITPEMFLVAEESKKYVRFEKQWVGSMWTTPSNEILKEALKYAPLQIGIPIPNDVGVWNSGKVIYDGKKIVQHAIELWKVDEDGIYHIFDQYMPNLKTLSPDYYVPFVSQGIAFAMVPIDPPIVIPTVDNPISPVPVQPEPTPVIISKTWFQLFIDLIKSIFK